MTKEVSPSEYQQLTGNDRPSRTVTINTSTLIPVIAVIMAILLLGASYAAGVSHGKHHPVSDRNGTPAATRGLNRFGRGGFRSGRRPAFGRVTAVSNDSLTIKNTRTGNSQTFKLTSTTTVDNNGSSGAVSDIKTGDTVIVTTSTSDTSTAVRIIINPDVPAMPSSGSDTSQGTPTQST